jgi:ribosomal protein L16 Arg81 hydroxylase
MVLTETHAVFTSSGLAQLIAPISEEDFVEHTLHQTFLHIPGSSSRFSTMYGWEQLNALLNEHRLKPPRMRVFRDGNAIDPRRYFRFSSSKDPLLDPIRLTDELTRGATLVIDAIEDTVPPLRALAKDLEWALRSRISVNLYAGWGKSRGFDLHFDDHDVFILQISGEKEWQVYGHTRPFPFMEDLERTTRPDGAPVWNSRLKQGDLLYIPRGWWHVAHPVGAPSLHLTVGMIFPTGLELLHWYVDQLKEDINVRRDLPNLLPHAKQLEYTGALSEMLAHFPVNDAIGMFLEDRARGVLSRAQMALPGLVARSITGDSEEMSVRLYAARQLTIGPSPLNTEAIEVTCRDITLTCPVALEAALAQLNDGQEHSVASLLQNISLPNATNMLQDVVSNLAAHHLLTTSAEAKTTPGVGGPLVQQ